MAHELTYIMVDLQPQTAYWRGIIAGAARYCTEHPNLRLRLPTSEWVLIGDEEAISGVIAVVREPETFEQAKRFGKPVVNVSSTAWSVPFPTVTIDNAAVGRMAGDHLLSQGYHHFAYHMESSVYFARERLRGFSERLAQVGRTVSVFDTRHGTRPDSSPAAQRRATIEWLQALPKPVGLFAHNDNRASMLIDICHEVGLGVPEQVGVMGMDDDQLLALSCAPPLSSIDPAADLIGYRATAMLVDIIGGVRSTPSVVLIPPRQMVVRQSTQPVFMDDEMLAKAITFIRQHACDPITMYDLLDHVPLSRRSLERRFRERLGRSPGDEIRRVQMDKAKQLLIETDHPLEKVAAASGYSRFRNFATAFRRELGVGPSAYRKSFRMR